MSERAAPVKKVVLTQINRGYTDAVRGSVLLHPHCQPSSPIIEVT